MKNLKRIFIIITLVAAMLAWSKVVYNLGYKKGQLNLTEKLINDIEITINKEIEALEKEIEAIDKAIKRSDDAIEKSSDAIDKILRRTKEKQLSTPEKRR